METINIRPANMPASWAAGIDSLVSLQAAIGVNSTHTETWLDKFLTIDPTCLKIKEVCRTISQFTPIQTILITGPSGHGKEILANALHWRPTSPFVPVNCAAIPDTLITSILFGHVKGIFTGAQEDRPGVFEEAADGTVFLDEIGDMPGDQQCTLLRVLQERQVVRLGSIKPIPIKCRIVAATNAPEKLRDDLMGRLMAIRLDIPPLSTRPDDVQLIAGALNLPASIYDETQLNLYGVRYLQSLAMRKMIGL